MKTLYDLLDVRPDDDAEGLRQAFRRAVKTSHPDVHTDDPDAPTRFRHFVQAYAILRDPERRADYDRLLELEREQLRSNSYTMRKFAFDAIAIAGFAALMVGGYPLYTHISKTFVEAVAVVEAPARGRPEIAAVEPAARTDTTDRDEPRGKLAVPDMATAPSAVASADTIARSDQMAPISPRHSGRAHSALDARVNALSPRGPESITTGPSNTARPVVMDSGLAGQKPAPRNDDSGTSSSGEAAGIADGGQALSPAGRDTEVAKIANAFDAAVDRAGAMTAAPGLKENSGIEPLDQKNARPVEVQPSSLEKDGDVPKALSSVFWTEKRDVKTRDIKTPDMKTPERPRVVAKRQATGQPPLKQVSLESRSTPVSSHAAPVFGVGF
jgi:curved DNA-binding protein CbpA